MIETTPDCVTKFLSNPLEPQLQVLRVIPRRRQQGAAARVELGQGRFAVHGHRAVHVLGSSAGAGHVQNEQAEGARVQVEVGSGADQEVEAVQVVAVLDEETEVLGDHGDRPADGTDV